MYGETIINPSREVARMFKTIIADDSRIFRKSLARIVDQKCEVVGFAQDGLEAFELYKEHNPELVLLDITMPNCDGKECLSKIMEFNPQATVIMISGLECEHDIKECLEMGAKGYIAKSNLTMCEDNKTSELVQVIDNIFMGKAA